MSDLENRFNAPRVSVGGEKITKSGAKKVEAANDNKSGQTRTKGKARFTPQPVLKATSGEISFDTSKVEAKFKADKEQQKFEKDFTAAFEEELAKPEPETEVKQEPEPEVPTTSWEDQVATLTTEIKRTAEEQPHLKDTSKPNTLDLEGGKTNMHEVLGAMRPLPLTEWVGRQLAQNNAKKEYLEDKGLVLKLEKTLQGMKPSELMKIGITSGDLKRISPDDKIDQERMIYLTKRSLDENKGWLSRRRAGFKRFFGVKW